MPPTLRHTSPLRGSTERTRGILAKLLAKENVTVQHGDFSTAFFDTEHRILGLPRWDISDQATYNMFIGHEVGHALFTPESAIPTIKSKYKHIPFSIFNVIEDIRIERMIQDSYPGLMGDFIAGYQYLLSQDFFGLKRYGGDVSKAKFLDRLNIHAKAGRSISVPFTKEELAFYDKAYAAQTIDDVYVIVEEVYAYLESRKKEEKKRKKRKSDEPKDEEEPKDDPSAGGDDDGDDEESEMPKHGAEDEDEEDSREAPDHDMRSGDDDSEVDPPEDEEPQVSYDKDDWEPPTEEDEEDDGDPAPLTKHLASSLEKLKAPLSNVGTFVAPSRKDVYDIVVPIEKVMANRMAFSGFKYEIETDTCKKDWLAFKKATDKHITHLVQQFNRKKSADQYKRATTSRTGTLNTKTLHRYKFDDQIFKQVTTLADARSHGMIFLIDWSGSMRNILPKVLDHVLNLVMFCRAVGIPHDVYCFTTRGFNSDQGPGQASVSKLVPFISQCRLTHVVSSLLPKKDYEASLRQLRCISRSAAAGVNSAIPVLPQTESLGSTPLHEALIALHTLAHDFKARHGIQKLINIVLSDGDGDGLYYGSGGGGEERGGSRSIRKGTILGREVTLHHNDGHQLHASLVENLTLSLDCTTVGFYLTEGDFRNAETIISRGLTASAKKSKRKNASEFARSYADHGIAHVPNGECYSYSDYFVLSGGFALTIKDEDVADALDKVHADSVTHKFEEVMANKRRSRILLDKFTDAIS